MAIFEQKSPPAMKRFMTALGVADFQAGGMMGNAGWESAGLTTLHQIHGTAIGWFQDDGPRATALLAFAHARNLDWESDDANIEFCISELLGSQHQALAALRATKTLKEACDAFEAYFERAGVPALSGRELYATRAMAAYRAAQAPVTQPSLPVPPLPPPIPATPTTKPSSVWDEMVSFLESIL